jgi:hypothetical protein
MARPNSRSLLVASFFPLVSRSLDVHHNFMDTTHAEILADGAWLAHRYQCNTDEIHFVQVTRGKRRAATFLTDEYLGDNNLVIKIPRNEAMAHAPPAAPLQFIFHSAFCGSTLLAQALEMAGVASSLKEPAILNDLIGIAHRGELPPSVLGERLDNFLHLLARPLAEGENVILKPSNVVNAFLTAVLSASQDSHALLLYAPLESYIKSIVKKGIDGRLWVRDLLVKQRSDDLINLGFKDQDYVRLTDIQVAAVGWLSQHAMFHRVANQFGPQRIATLDSETLFNRPYDALLQLARHFGLNLSESDVREIVTGPAFNFHSKTGLEFSALLRAKEYDDAFNIHEDEIMKVLYWSNIVSQNSGIKMNLPYSLI